MMEDNTNGITSPGKCSFKKIHSNRKTWRKLLRLGLLLSLFCVILSSHASAEAVNFSIDTDERAVQWTVLSCF
jgi:hypothetical protein